MIQFRARHGARYFFLPSAQTFETFARNLISPSAFTSLETGERESHGFLFRREKEKRITRIVLDRALCRKGDCLEKWMKGGAGWVYFCAVPLSFPSEGRSSFLSPFHSTFPLSDRDNSSDSSLSARGFTVKTSFAALSSISGCCACAGFSFSLARSLARSRVLDLRGRRVIDDDARFGGARRSAAFRGIEIARGGGRRGVIDAVISRN